MEAAALADTDADTDATPPETAGLHAALAQLMLRLEAHDLEALEIFAAQRGTLASAPPALFAALEQALQDLELDRAQRVCQQMAAWLDAGAARLPPATGD
jgi:hypothetical protein